jgi:uncharacterized protein YecE (DUF72 family)
LGELRIGCAGWSYRDWVGPVYPPHVPPSRWLETYASMFPLVEIDSTFYALPSPETVEGWVRRSQSLPGFGFAAKVPQDVTHRHLVKGSIEDARRVAAEFERIVLAPIEAARRLEAVLLQLPPNFTYFGEAGETDTLAALVAVVEALGPKRRRVAVEFRHQSWFEHVGESLVSDVTEALSAVGAGVVYVDGLGSRFHGTRTTDWSYVRLHGRRTEMLPGERTLSHAPYNYLYGADEIREVAAKVSGLMPRDERTIVIFNNHYRGQAAHNAMDLMQALGQPRPKPLVPFARETRLDQFGG